MDTVLVICVALAFAGVSCREEYQFPSKLSKQLSAKYDINQYTNEEDLISAVDSNLDNSNDIDSSHDQSALFETIPGTPQHDYPTYDTIPKTSFSCKGRVNWGYYADVETSCQVFHVCESEHSKVSFLCPVGSAFNQKHLVCDWWYNFDCYDEIRLTSLFDDYDLSRDGSDAGDGSHQPGNDRDNRSSSRSERTLAKRRDFHGAEYEEVDNDDLYDLNLVSSGGNV